MRRGAGLAAFSQQSQASTHFATLSSSISSSQLTQLTSQITQFRSALTHFASTHRQKIHSDPSFRHAFQQMCLSIGVDPLAGPKPGYSLGGGGGGSGGWWSDLLGIGDWQYELGVQIVDVCVSTRDRNGGLIEISELIRLVSKLRGIEAGSSNAITEVDILQSLKTLQPLGSGYSLVEINGTKFVRSVPKQLDDDQTSILALAQLYNGRVVEEMLIFRYNWSRERARTALENMLVRDGLCWLDDQDEEYGRAYWVPSAMHWEVEGQESNFSFT